MSDANIIEINGVEVNLEDAKAREDIETINTQLGDIANKIKDTGNTSCDLNFTEVPIQPSTYASTTIQSDTLYTLFDSFIDNNSTYKFTKTLLGKDTSNTYDIYKYVFEPVNYTRTIMLTAGMHGNEIVSPIALYRFLYHIINDNQNIENYTYIKENVRIIMIPLVNPWGFNQTPRQYGNVNGVNSSRNFDYNWDSYVSSGTKWDKKGDSAYSELETQYMRDTYLEYKNSLEFTLDCHTAAGYSEDILLYYVESDNVLRPKLLECVTWNTNRISTKYSKTPSVTTEETARALNLLWLNKIQGIPSATIEYVPNKFGGGEAGATDLLEYVTLLTNYISVALNKEAFSIDTSNLATKTELSTLETKVKVINNNIPFSFMQITKDDYNSLTTKVTNRVYLVEGYGMYLGTTCIISTDNQQGSGGTVSPSETGLLASVNLSNGNISDTSGKGNNATLSGTYTTDTDGIVFDGKDGVIDTGLKLLQSDDEFSVIYTFMPLNISNGTSQYVISQGNGSEVGSLLHQFSSNTNGLKIIKNDSPLTFYFDFGNSNHKTIGDSITLSINTKYICCITYKNNTLSYYVNGALRATYNEQIQLANANFVLGNRSDKIRGFNGKIYSYKIYNSCLTSEYVNKIVE